VDAGIAGANELASTGDSYGGGQTWLLATSPPWQSPNGVTLQLAAGVPKYGWTAGVHLLGLPTVQLPYTLAGQDATVAFKLWDQRPDGSKTLVTRAAYRLSTAAGDPAIGIQKTYLYGNEWVFPAGDTIILQVTQNDAPYLRPDNEPSAIVWSGVTLDLPARGS
jgi:hypothetical protein